MVRNPHIFDVYKAEFLAGHRKYEEMVDVVSGSAKS